LAELGPEAREHTIVKAVATSSPLRTSSLEPYRYLGTCYNNEPCLRFIDFFYTDVPFHGYAFTRRVRG
jgi:hypothetical protein